MEAIFLDCGAGGPQLKRNPLGGQRGLPVNVRDLLGRLWERLQGPPAQRSTADVIAILERELQGSASVDEWDDFISIPIADPDLDAVRRLNHFAGGELPESRQIIERSLVDLRERLAAQR